MWNVVTGQALPPFAPGQYFIYGLHFSADDGQLACACAEGAAVYRLPGLEKVDITRGVMVRSAAFSPDGRTLAIPSLQEDVVRLWPVGTGLERTTLPHRGLPRRVAFSRDGRYLLTATERSVRVWDFAGPSEKRVLAGHTTGVAGVAFSPDGATLASVSKASTLRLWDTATGATREPLARFTGQGQAVAFSPDGRLVATGDYTTSKAQLWDAASSREVATVTEGLSSRVHTVAFSPGGRYFAAGSVQGWRLFHIDRSPDTDKPVRLRRLERGPPEAGSAGHLCFSPDDTVVAWSTNDGKLHAWDLVAGQSLLADMGPAANRLLSHSLFPDGRRPIFVNRHLEAEVWDIRRQERTATFLAKAGRSGDVVGYAQHVCLSPDGQCLATSSLTGRGVNLFDGPSGQYLATLPEELGIVWCLAWSPDSRRLAVGRSNGGLSVWDYQNCRQQLSDLGSGW